MSYRVFIPTAGTGSRLGKLTKYINKSLVSIANRPVISHQIEQFPEDCEFVIALGHKGNLVKDFLELTYPKKKFHFAKVDPFEGSGSGLGLSMLACEDFLQEPFIFLSCDTLVKEIIQPPNHNWMGYSKVNDLMSYRTLDIVNERVNEICEKGVIKESLQAYIGISGIYDYKDFWQAMHKGKILAIEKGESYGLSSIINNGVVKPYQFTWFDSGLPEKLKEAREAYRQIDEPNILEKENEAIWFIRKKVIKYSDDEKFISNRVKRTTELKGFIPEILASKKNMYYYQKAEGEVLSKSITIPLFEKLLKHSQSFWIKERLSDADSIKFKKSCKIFYKDKTRERIELFYKNFNKFDVVQSINGQEQILLIDLLNLIDWDWLCDGLPGRFHGDFHFENILWSSENKNFTFLDWRQDFAGSLTSGDIYYDFAKLMHGLIVSHDLISKNHFTVKWNNDTIVYDLYRKQILVECEQQFNIWLQLNGYDLKKVRVLTALIYLNIAALHHYPYSLLLYGLGKKLLSDELKN
jgi:choline kinase